MGILRTIFVLVFVYYLIKVLNRYVLPIFRNKTQTPKRGNTPRKKPKMKDPGGEYVDFKEID